MNKLQLQASYATLPPHSNGPKLMILEVITLNLTTGNQISNREMFAALYVI